jgi:hypothetical protein
VSCLMRYCNSEMKLAACPEVDSGITSKPSFIVANTDFLNIRLYLYWLELVYLAGVRRWIVSGSGFRQ